ncbi:MAG TPA: energy transducer TonB [Candidatus Limnocylindrales bacterium]|nr:energy transducer TonB [Candidatus Limnocylindrales bacterium]
MDVVATIGVDGRVKNVQVLHGHPLLQKAATDAILQWQYRPTLLNGVPVQNETRITLNFTGTGQ